MKLFCVGGGRGAEDLLMHNHEGSQCVSLVVLSHASPSVIMLGQCQSSQAVPQRKHLRCLQSFHLPTTAKDSPNDSPPFLTNAQQSISVVSACECVQEVFAAQSCVQALPMTEKLLSAFTTFRSACADKALAKVMKMETKKIPVFLNMRCDKGYTRSPASA